MSTFTDNNDFNSDYHPPDIAQKAVANDKLESRIAIYTCLAWMVLLGFFSYTESTTCSEKFLMKYIGSIFRVSGYYLLFFMACSWFLNNVDHQKNKMWWFAYQCVFVIVFYFGLATIVLKSLITLLFSSNDEGCGGSYHMAWWYTMFVIIGMIAKMCASCFRSCYTARDLRRI